MKNTIKLFKAVRIPDSVNKEEYTTIDNDLLMLTLPYGFVIAPSISGVLSKQKVLTIIEHLKSLALTGSKLNASFHKSWKKVETASMEQLVIEQIMHYITTYGFESIGCFSNNTVYIPTEELNIPGLDIDKLPLTIIRGLTAAEIKEKLLSLLQSGIALKAETIKTIVEVADPLLLTASEIDSIKNKEVKVIMYDKTSQVPESPIEFLRFIIYKASEKTLIIKNRATIEALKAYDKNKLCKLFLLYEHNEKLSEVFFRYKPLWLAMKGTPYMNTKINSMRKRAIKNHKPMKPDFLNDVTNKIKNNIKVDHGVLAMKLKTVNTFRKIRLAYALHFRTTNTNSILYNVRNGKAFAKEFSFDNSVTANTILQIVLESIKNDLKANVSGKTIYIPSNIKYALPYTEKQFTGNIPNGTCVTTDKDMIFGVHWENIKHNRIDLDLSLISLKTGKIGWDSMYRTEDKKILFSGDVTDAPKPKGASEMFYIKKQDENALLLSVNYYNFDEDLSVPCQIVIGQDTPTTLERNYMLNPNKVIATTDTIIDVKQKILGLIVTTHDSNKFYFAEANMGKSITSSNKPYMEHTRKYLLNYYSNTIELNKLLVEAGALLSSDITKCDIDLSLENVDKTTIIDLFKQEVKQ